MKIVKRFIKDEQTSLISGVFDEFLVSDSFHLPFDSIEFHIRDSDISIVKGDKALVCLDYNNPLFLQKDIKGIKTIVRHEFFRLMFKTNLSRDIEDVIIGREMIKRGFGEDLLYVYYHYIVNSKATNIQDYIKSNLPWIIFQGYDKNNSEFLKKATEKQNKRRKICDHLFDLLTNLSSKNLHEVIEEYKKLIR